MNKSQSEHWRNIFLKDSSPSHDGHTHTQKKDHEHADSPIYDALTVNTAFSNYKSLYSASIQDPSSFWTTQAHKYISWFQPPPATHPALHGNFDRGDFTFFAGGKLNVCYNAIDRHVYERNGEGGSDIAMIWEGDEPTDIKTFTYDELLQHVSRIANALKSQGVQKGDKVTIYMPMIPELPMTMLACARIGAPHSVSDGSM
jgi:acetyl-CoA synthetase